MPTPYWWLNVLLEILLAAVVIWLLLIIINRIDAEAAAMMLRGWFDGQASA